MFAKWFLCFYWAPPECACWTMCSWVILQPKATIMNRYWLTHPTLNWSHPLSTVREVPHMRFSWKSYQIHMVCKIANPTSGLSQALWPPGGDLWPCGVRGTWTPGVLSGWRGKPSAMRQRDFTGVKHSHIHMLIPRTCDHVTLPGRKRLCKWA
jgi:hypothetical protein